MIDFTIFELQGCIRRCFERRTRKFRQSVLVRPPLVFGNSVVSFSDCFAVLCACEAEYQREEDK